jgi:hypothetical protein
VGDIGESIARSRSPQAARTTCEGRGGCCRSTGRWDPKRQRTAGAGVSRAGIIGRVGSPGSRRYELAATGGVDLPKMKRCRGTQPVNEWPGFLKVERALEVNGTTLFQQQKPGELKVERLPPSTMRGFPVLQPRSVVSRSYPRRAHRVRQLSVDGRACAASPVTIGQSRPTMPY